MTEVILGVVLLVVAGASISAGGWIVATVALAFAGGCLVVLGGRR